MLKALAAAVSVLAFLLAGSAWADVARHERIEIKPVLEGGKAVGMKIKLTLRPEGYKLARTGVSLVGKKQTSPKETDWQRAKHGTLDHKIGETSFASNSPHPTEFTVLFKDLKGFTPGTAFQVVTAFNGGDTKGYWHVFGITGVPGATPTSYKVPRVAQAAPPPAKKPIAAKKPAAKKPAATAKKPATATKPAAKKPAVVAARLRSQQSASKPRRTASASRTSSNAARTSAGARRTGANATRPRARAR